MSSPGYTTTDSQATELPLRPGYNWSEAFGTRPSTTGEKNLLGAAHEEVEEEDDTEIERLSLVKRKHKAAAKAEEYSKALAQANLHDEQTTELLTTMENRKVREYTRLLSELHEDRSKRAKELEELQSTLANRDEQIRALKEGQRRLNRELDDVKKKLTAKEAELTGALDYADTKIVQLRDRVSQEEQENEEVLKEWKKQDRLFTYLKERLGEVPGSGKERSRWTKQAAVIVAHEYRDLQQAAERMAEAIKEQNEARARAMLEAE